VIPADGNWAMTPDKIWFATAEGMDVRAAFNAFEVPNVTEQLMAILERGMQLAEEFTSIPLISQGESGKTTPETFGAAQLQNNNANQLLRSIGYAFDDYVTEPLVRQFYEWYLLDPDIASDDKGEFQINAHGSVALVERAIMNQTIAQMGNMALNPAYGVDPKKWFKLFCKANRINIEDVQYTEEEQERMAQQPPPAAPAVEAAKIRAEVEKEANANDLQVKREQIHADVVLGANDLQLKKELAMLEYANREKVNIDTVKAQLAKTAMQLRTEQELNAQNNAVEIHKHHTQPPAPLPAVQAPGRAANGRAAAQSNTP
jgi:hypothetical protein